MTDGSCTINDESRFSVGDIQERIQCLAADSPGFSLVSGFESVSQPMSVFQAGGSAGGMSGDKIQVGCIAKLLTTALIIAAAEGGALSLECECTELPELNERLRRVLPEGLKVRHLLDHTHGMPDVFCTGVSTGDFLHEEFVADTLEHHDAISRPGELFSYSNTGLVLAALILERIYRRPYRALLTEIVLRPLGFIGEARTPCPATGGGIVVPMEILLRFCARQYQSSFFLDKQAGGGAQGVPWHPVVPVPGWALESGVGLGWKYYGGSWYGHNGIAGGNTLVVRLDPVARRTVVLFGNRASVNAVQNQVFANALWPVPRFGVTPGRGSHSEMMSSGVSGTYVNGPVAVRVEANDPREMALKVFDGTTETEPTMMLRHRSGMYVPRLKPNPKIPFAQMLSGGTGEGYLWNGGQLFRRKAA